MFLLIGSLFLGVVLAFIAAPVFFDGVCIIFNYALLFFISEILSLTLTVRELYLLICVLHLGFVWDKLNHSKLAKPIIMVGGYL